MATLAEVRQILEEIYGNRQGAAAFEKIHPLIPPQAPGKGEKQRFSEQQGVLITYGDSLSDAASEKPPLKTLHKFAKKRLAGVFSHIHILPFYPYSSDDGFSVKDFFAVDPDLGTWADILEMKKDVDLMFDYVLNHMSAQSQWFADFLAGKDGANDLAIVIDPDTDLSMVVRPRALPLLTAFDTADRGTVHVWTTFSDDQIDLNYNSIEVLSRMIKVLLFYVENGASILRLDAVAYLWKEMGTGCIHLPKAHAMVKLFRKILDIAAPHVMLLTETNVPHVENISYFGNGVDEAQMVYNFTLPPLLLYSFLKQDATQLSAWAKTLSLESEENTFFNFTASHDGIGVRPLEGILPPSEISWLAEQTAARGGHISYRQNPDGSQSPYELNITYVSAMAEDEDPLQENQIQKFLASQAVCYVLPGVPATYIHSLLGSQNWGKGVEKTGRFRTINREKLDAGIVGRELSDPKTFRSKIFYPYLQMIRTRKKQPAFHPTAGFEILDSGPGIFGIKRFTEKQVIYCLTNVTATCQHTALSVDADTGEMADLVSGHRFDCRNLEIAPYGYVWLNQKSY